MCRYYVGYIIKPYLSQLRGERERVGSVGRYSGERERDREREGEREYSGLLVVAGTTKQTVRLF